VADTLAYYAAIASKLQTLPATLFEADTGLTAVCIDVAGVRQVSSAVKHTRTRGRHLEGHVPEVARLQLVQDVVPSGSLPAHQVTGFDQDRAGPLITTSAAK
jgi:hypothetical protein